MMERLTEWKDDKKLLAKTKFSGDFGSANVLNRLAEYEDLEEQGLLLRLPCKAGDTVYYVNTDAKKPIIKMQVLQVNYKQFYKDSIFIRIDATNDKDMGKICYLLEDDFGKTVFLTKEEAEQKLKEMEM